MCCHQSCHCSDDTMLTICYAFTALHFALRVHPVLLHTQGIVLGGVCTVLFGTLLGCLVYKRRHAQVIARMPSCYSILVGVLLTHVCTVIPSSSHTCTYSLASACSYNADAQHDQQLLTCYTNSTLTRRNAMYVYVCTDTGAGTGDWHRPCR
jgi:hypothetical protein